MRSRRTLAGIPRWCRLGVRERFPDAEVVELNAGMGSTCSTSGAFRVGAHILSMGAVDLFVVEFAVNDDQDAAHPPQECVRGMEGVIRQVRREQPNCEIVMIYYVNEGMLEKVRGGEVLVSIAAHESVAAHYGVTSVNVAAEVADAVGSGKYTWKDYGGTHPGKFGYEVASNMVIAALESGLGKKGTKKKEPPALIDAFSYVNGKFVSPESAVTSKGWKSGRVSKEMIPKGGIREQYLEYQVLRAEKPHDALILGFDGNEVGAFVLAGPDAGMVEARIDGGPPTVHDLYHRFSKKLNYPRSVVFASGLAPGKHRIDLVVSKSKNPASSGNAVNILFFEVNEDAGEWVDLFDEKTTKGWMPREEVVKFEAVDNELHLVSEKNVWVTSDLELEDFIFEGDVKIPADAAETGFNGGLAFRCLGETGKPSYQCEIDGPHPGETGGVYGIGLGGWLYPKEEDAEEHRGRILEVLKKGDWNTYLVRCEGRRIQTWVNGALITDIEDEQSLGGYFGIQHHGKGGVVKFRRLRVKDLR